MYNQAVIALQPGQPGVADSGAGLEPGGDVKDLVLKGNQVFFVEFPGAYDQDADDHQGQNKSGGNGKKGGELPPEPLNHGSLRFPGGIRFRGPS